MVEMSGSSGREPKALESWTTCSEAETRRVGRHLAESLGGGGVLLLFGGMGAGKTVLAKGAAEAIGIDPAEVQSPTFTVINEVLGANGACLVHVDLYRLEPEEVAELGLEELLVGPGLKIVEWAERSPRLWAELWPELEQRLREGGWIAARATPAEEAPPEEAPPEEDPESSVWSPRLPVAVCCVLLRPLGTGVDAPEHDQDGTGRREILRF